MESPPRGVCPPHGCQSVVLLYVFWRFDMDGEVFLLPLKRIFHLRLYRYLCSYRHVMYLCIDVTLLLFFGTGQFLPRLLFFVFLLNRFIVI